jgi:hypothetical protein
MKTLKKCRICNSNKFWKVISYKRTACDGSYSLSPNLIKTYEKTNLTLLQCQECGFFQLKEIVDSSIYQNYAFESHFTDSIVKWMETIASLLTKKYKIANKKILEVGSGDGSFLKYFASSNKVLGIEPSKQLAIRSNINFIPTINNYFDTDFVNKVKEKFDFIFVRHVLEHIDSLDEFCLNLSLAAKDDSLIYIESPYVLDIFKTNNFFNVFYEHVNYFCLQDIQKLFNKYGFSILEYGFNEINNGSFWAVLSKKKGKKIPDDRIKKQLRDEFSKQFNNLKKIFKDIKTEIKDKKTAGYGAANKTFSILSLGEFTNSQIIEIYDKNENLWGKYISEFSIPIVTPKQILKTKPEYLILFATSYQEEIIKFLKELKYNGKIIRLLPEMLIEQL